MNNSNLVSIIVPAYNAGNYLKDCIDSLLNQTYNNVEIIVIDDGSTDNSFDFMPQVAGKKLCMGGGKILINNILGNIKILRINNSGVTAARRMGVEIANGDWIAFVDADDIVEKEYIANLIKLTDDKTDLVIGNSLTEGSISVKTFTSSLLGDNLFPTVPVSKLYRKRLFNQSVLDIPRNIVRGEDLLMLLRMNESIIGKIVLSTCNNYYYRSHSCQVTRTFKTDSKYELEFYKYLLKSFSNREMYSEFGQQLIKIRLSAVELILLGLKETNDYSFKKSEWYRTLMLDIHNYKYKLSIWERVVLLFGNAKSIRFMRYAKDKLKCVFPTK